MYSINEEDVSIYLYFLKLLFIIIGTYYVLKKSLRQYNDSNNENRIKHKIIYGMIVCIISIICCIIKLKINTLMSISTLIILLSSVLSISTKRDMAYSITTIMFSISINYIIFFISTVVNSIPCILLDVKNDIISFSMISIGYIIFLLFIMKIKRIKYGFSFINQITNNDYITILLLNICTAILFLIGIIHNNSFMLVMNFGLILFVVIFIMIISIKKSIEAYYKQKLFIRELNETKKELEEKKKEIKELEEENLRFSKKAHSLSHKQKSLEFKINKLLLNSESALEVGLQDELEKISNELIENSKLPKLDKTGISEIDDMLNLMQEECRLNGIDFILQLKGNIYQMINNYITKEELSIMIADHIKDGIIAINHSDNINKSIMVRIGKIEEYFAVYFYDSGVEFPKEVLNKLGKKPVTTYANEGGTGMGFMNTFDLLKKYKASLIIESIGKPCKDNYTKIIKIVFDNKQQVII